jgi:hypothetical protein
MAVEGVLYRNEFNASSLGSSTLDPVNLGT